MTLSSISTFFIMVGYVPDMNIFSVPLPYTITVEKCVNREHLRLISSRPELNRVKIFARSLEMSVGNEESGLDRDEVPVPSDQGARSQRSQRQEEGGTRRRCCENGGQRSVWQNLPSRLTERSTLQLIRTCFLIYALHARNRIFLTST